MKIQKYPCTNDIRLFYSKVTLVILVCILKHNYQNNTTQFSKEIDVMEKRPLYLRNNSETKANEKITKGQ